MLRMALPTVLMMLGLLAACGRQVDSSFQGDSLLTLRGSVAIPAALTGVDLEPAIVWHAPTEDGDTHLRIAQVDVAGDFPSSFTLDVFDPPPPEALTDQDILGEPAYATGQVTAVAPEYPDAVTFNWIPSGCGSGCDSNLICSGAERPHDLQSESDACYRQDIDCNAFVASQLEGGPQALAECDLVAVSGDEGLAFGGFSRDIEIVYFDQAIAAGTLLAERYGVGEAIGAGYHVYEHTPASVPEAENAEDFVPSEADECYVQAETQALDLYNDEHGTSFDAILQYDDAGMNNPAFYDLQRTILRVRRELGCPRPPSEYVHVDVEVGAIEIELGVPSLMTSGL